jgi:hypothetical protein
MRTLLSVILLILLTCQSCSKEDTTQELLEENTEQGEEMPDQGESPEDTPDSEEEVPEEEEEESSEQSSECPTAVGFIFEETNGIVSIEFEDNDFPSDWVLKNDVNEVSGEGYMQWEGSPNMGSPGNGMVTFPIRITNIGTYRFTWKSSYRKGSNGTEHNDSWLRFPDANDFFGMKNNGSVVYPNDSGKEPNPNGASKDGWFKIYRSGNDNSFKWQAKTSDNDAHDIYVVFETEGIYLMEVSARSDFHAIDRILLFKQEISQNDAISQAEVFSNKIPCN